jgi:hypothetical protein
LQAKASAIPSFFCWLCDIRIAPLVNDRLQKSSNW